MPTERDLIDILADQAAELDELAADHLEAYAERTRELIGNPAQRDPDVWSLYAADLDLTVDDFALVPRLDRDSEWSERLGSLILAARQQAFVEISVRPLLAIADAHGDKSRPLSESLTPEQAKQAARLGISEDAISVAARNRQAAKAEREAAQATAELTDG